MSKFILLPGPHQALLPTLLTVALLAFDIPGALSPHPSPSISTASQPGDGKPTAVFLPSPLPSPQMPQTGTSWLCHLLPNPTIFITKRYVPKCHHQ